MADVTISQLTQSTPAGSSILPYSTGSNTLGVPVSAILQDAGNIGIGNNSPQSKLHVYDASNSLIALGRAGNPQALAKWEYNSGTCSFGTRDTDNLELITNNVSRLFMNTVGNVGIGTSSPTTKLDVAGTVNATNIYKGGVEVPIGIGGMKLFTTAGANTWTVPNLITKIKITAIGGGAGGGPSGGNAGGSSSITGINIVAGAGNGTTAGAATGDSNLLVYSAGGTSGVLFSTTTNPGFKLLGIAYFGNGGAPGTSGGASGGTGAYASGVVTVTPGATLTVNVGAGGGARSGSGNSQSGSAGCVLIEW